MCSEKIEKARSIAYKAHSGQTDKAGKPYTEHLEFVAANVEGENEKIVAYLHDILEDTEYPSEKIEADFGHEIYSAVCTMTHRKGENYFDYIRRVSENPIAKKVKTADLKNNMMLERLPVITENDRKRLKKYKKAYEILNGQSI